MKLCPYCKPARPLQEGDGYDGEWWCVRCSYSSIAEDEKKRPIESEPAPNARKPRDRSGDVGRKR